MATLLKTTAIKSETSESGKTSTTTTTSMNSNINHETNKATDVQAYLISNYREALKKGDKSAAKSCLLAARYFSVNDASVTNEIYLMAKSDGDVNEASKCFANMFNDLFLDNHQDASSSQTTEQLSVINQMKEEVKLLLGDLSSQYLKLKSIPNQAALKTFQVPSHNPTPMLSPSLRLSSEDRLASRESTCRLVDTHLHSLNKSLFYQQLFDYLPEETRRSILNHSIESTENILEKCRLMMLSISIFHDTCSTYGSRLLRKLLDLCTAEPMRLDDDRLLSCITPTSLMCQYAKSLLVLDAIPLVSTISQDSPLDIDLEELYRVALDFYSEHCLETSATEYEASELHEGVKKSRIKNSQTYASEHNSQLDEAIEEQLLITLNLLSNRFLKSFSDYNEIDENELKNLKNFHNTVTHIHNDMKDRELPTLPADTENLLDLLKQLQLDEEVPDDILFAPREEGSSSQPVATPPPKSRGRPKKGHQSVIVNLDDALKRDLQHKSRKIQFAFHTIVQHLFVTSAYYLKNSRSKILMNFHNPLAPQLETEVTRGTNQRSSRSKSHNVQSAESLTHSPKKQKLDLQSNKQQVDVPMEVESTNQKDLAQKKDSLSPSLWSAHLCYEFLNSNYGSFTRLWQRFLTSSNTPELNWYRRFSIDQMMLLGQHEKVSELLEIVLDTKKNECEIKKDHSLNGTSTLTVLTGTPSVTVMELRNIIQLVSCNVQKCDKIKTFYRIEEFINKIRQIGLLANDDKHNSDDTIADYKLSNHDSGIGFLYFDAPCMLRYCIDLFMDILERLVTNSSIISDSSIGHTIVMSQFIWPKRCRLYEQCMSWLRNNKPKSTTPQSLSAATKFTYSEFFQYVHNPNIIEDFMALLCQGYTLDIKCFNSNSDIVSSQSSVTAKSNQGSTTRSGKAITTRGVNKSFKEDLKVSLIAQMKCSTLFTPLDTVCEFIQSTMIPFLTSNKR